MFELDNEVEYRELEEDIEMDINGIIVGGHDKWQQKMKESLPRLSLYQQTMKTLTQQ